MSSDRQDNGADAQATDGMVGDGYYDRHSESQKNVIRGQEPRLRDAVRHLDLSGPELRIMDYGCGPGRNSMSAFHTILDEVRRRDAAMPIVAAHNDLIGNDWNGLFANVQGPEGYLHDAEHIRVEAAIGSFFEPVASATAVDLGISFAAAHWLSSAVRLKTPGSLFFCDLEEPARTQVADMADRDWTAFLRQRARELKPGGCLVVDSLSSVPDSDDPSGRCAAGRKLYRAFWKIADGLAAEGRIDPARLESFVFPVYFRLPEEFHAPFEREADLNDAFEIVEMTNESLPMPTEDALRRTGDAAAYAKAYAGFARAFAESTLRHGLFEEADSDTAAADALADEFFRRLEALFAAEPEAHGFEHLVMTMVLRRR